MKELPPGAVLSLVGDDNLVTIKTGSHDDALAVFDWLRQRQAKPEPKGDLINRRGAVCSRSGVVTVGGARQMQVGGRVAAVVTEQGVDLASIPDDATGVVNSVPAGGWFEVETANDKTFRFDRDTMQELDGNRWFEFDEEGN